MLNLTDEIGYGEANGLLLQCRITLEQYDKIVTKIRSECPHSSTRIEWCHLGGHGDRPYRICNECQHSELIEL